MLALHNNKGLTGGNMTSLSGAQISKQLSDIADYFIALSNETQSLITNLKLQKLVYYVQAWHLAVHGAPVFEDEIEAWVHGPVVPNLYRKYKELSFNPILEQKDESDQIFSTFTVELQAILNDVVEGYFGRTAFELEQLTHMEEPWITARKDVPSGGISKEVISKDSMREYYRQFVIT